MAARYEIMKVGEDEDFIQYTSPSVILGQLSKGDCLINWGVDTAIKYIVKYSYRQAGNVYSVQEKTLKEAGYAWKNKRDWTADLGSDLHHLVETYIHLELDNVDSKRKREFFELIARKQENLKNMFYQFIWWKNKHVKRFVESEQTVVDTNKCVAGTLDFIYEGFDELIYCVDLKTSNAIYQSHEIQVVSYKYARESMCGHYIVKSMYGDLYNKDMHIDKIKIDRCAILDISRDYFYLEYKIVNDMEHKQRSFEALLSYYYISAARRLNNKRAKERR